MARSTPSEQATGERKSTSPSTAAWAGTLMTTLAYMAAKKDKRAGATFFTTMLSTSPSRANWASSSTSRPSTRWRRRWPSAAISKVRRWPAPQHAACQRPDLVLREQYLMGKDPFPSTCSTEQRLDTHAVRHAQLLPAQHVPANKAARAGGIEIAGVPIDISKVKTPCYSLTVEDHIAPMEEHLQGRPPCLRPRQVRPGGSGHIAGIVPPAANKYGYWTNETLPESADAPARRRTPGS